MITEIDLKKIDRITYAIKIYTGERSCGMEVLDRKTN